jgi:hypothetical protein
LRSFLYSLLDILSYNAVRIDLTKSWVAGNIKFRESMSVWLCLRDCVSLLVSENLGVFRCMVYWSGASVETLSVGRSRIGRSRIGRSRIGRNRVGRNRVVGTVEVGTVWVGTM